MAAPRFTPTNPDTNGFEGRDREHNIWHIEAAALLANQGGGGAVASVNGQTGTVVLTGADIPGAVRVVGPLNLTFDQADLPGVSQLYTLVNGGGTFPFTGAGTYKLSAGRVVTDATINVDTVTLTSATAAFVGGDVGKPVVGYDVDLVPLFQTTIASRTNGTTIVLTDPQTPGALAFFVVGGTSRTFDYTDDIDDVQAGLDVLFGAGNTECFLGAALVSDVHVDALYILFKGAKASQAVGIIVTDDTGAETVAAYAQVFGSATARLGAVWFTPAVGDQILDLFWDWTAEFSNGADEVDIYYGDLSGVDPGNAATVGVALRKTLGALSGGGFNLATVATGQGASNTETMDLRGSPFLIRKSAAFASSSADYGDRPWAIRTKVKESVPLAFATVVAGVPPTSGEVDIYAVVVTPSAEY